MSKQYWSKKCIMDCCTYLSRYTILRVGVVRDAHGQRNCTVNFQTKKFVKYVSQIPNNVANLQASHVYFKRQEMICQCIIAASFASGRKQTSHGVVRFSVVPIRVTLTLCWLLPPDTDLIACQGQRFVEWGTCMTLVIC